MPLLNLQHTLHMCRLQHLSLLPRQQLRRLQYIFDFAAIHIKLRQTSQILITKTMPLFILRHRHAQKVIPNMTSGTLAKLIILHADVNSALKRSIDIIHTVCREEEDALVVFEDAEEDGDEFVALEVVGGALFEEDVGFVEEEDGVPFCGHFEYVGEGAFDRGGVEAEVAGGHHVEGCAHAFGD